MAVLAGFAAHQNKEAPIQAIDCNHHPGAKCATNIQPDQMMVNHSCSKADDLLDSEVSQHKGSIEIWRLILSIMT